MSKAVINRVQMRPGQHDPTFTFWCPGCQCGHGMWVEESNLYCGAKWAWNGSMDKPSFTPSLKIENAPRCHVIVTDGVLNFCPDCDHRFAGKRIRMVALEDARLDCPFEEVK